jgi:hypothetical protein
MTAMRSVFLAVFVSACAGFAAAGAAAEPVPLYDGTMTFQSIQGPDGPEEFLWELNLGPAEELRQMDDQHAAVYYTDAEEHLAFSITAEPAHAEGATVPTTIVVTQPNLLTLLVHHRDGNPMAGGDPFEYPILSGAGWDGGFQSVRIEGPPDESQLARPPISGTVEPLSPRCVVPDLSGRTLWASRKILHRARCKLGRVRGERSRAAHVAKQYRLAGQSLAAWTAVDVKVS